MDLEALHAHRFDRETMLQIVDYVTNNKNVFKKFINLFLTGSAEVSERSSWPLSYCAQRYPDWIIPHIGKLLRLMEESNPREGTRRNVMRALQFVQIPERFHAPTTNLCFRLLSSSQEPVAVKVFAMTVLAQLTKVYPELSRELEMVVEEQLAHSSAAFRSRARKLLGSPNR